MTFNIDFKYNNKNYKFKFLEKNIVTLDPCLENKVDNNLGSKTDNKVNSKTDNYLIFLINLVYRL